jgi:large subunit ribosomal protein L15
MAHESAEVLLYQLAMLDADVIDIVVLRAAKLVTGDAKKVKVVKKGELTKKLTIKGLLVTAGAKAAIEAAGGSVE